MPNQTKKFLDANGVAYLASLLDNYPDNDLLATVITAIGEELETKANNTLATTSSSGLMSAQDKEVLDNLNPNVTTTLSNLSTSQIEIINAKVESLLGITLKYEPIIAQQIRTSNLLNVNENTTPDQYISASGVPSQSTNHNDTMGDFIPVTPGQDIYYTGHVGQTTSSSINRRLHVYNANKTWIKQISFAGSLHVGDDWSTHGIVPNNGAYIRVSWGTADTRVMISVGAPSNYEPYYLTPFAATTQISFKVGETTDPEEATTYTCNLAQIYQPPADPDTTSVVDFYGLICNPITGVIYKTTDHIASYNGETLPGRWWSDRDEYAENTTPSTGAEVVYEVDDEDIEEYCFKTPASVTLNYHTNIFFADDGIITELSYYAETLAVDHLTVYNGMTLFGDVNVVKSDVQAWQHAGEVIDEKANLASPTFTGAPRLSANPGRSDLSTKIATTAFAQNLWDNVAPIETSSKSSRNYAVGDYMCYAGHLYKVTAAITSGTTITVGTNITATTVMDEIKALQ